MKALLLNVKIFIKLLYYKYFIIGKKYTLDHKFIEYNVNKLNLKNLDWVDEEYFPIMMQYYDIFCCKDCGMYILKDKLYKNKCFKINEQNLVQDISDKMYSALRYRREQYYSCVEFQIKSIIE